MQIISEQSSSLAFSHKMPIHYPFFHFDLLSLSLRLRIHYNLFHHHEDLGYLAETKMCEKWHRLRFGGKATSAAQLPLRLVVCLTEFEGKLVKHSISSGNRGLMTGRLLLLCLIHLLTTSVGFFIYNICPINSNFVTVGLFLKSIGKVFLGQYLIWVIVLLGQLHGYKSCIQKERKALLELKQYLISISEEGQSDYVLTTWTNDTKSQCCRWEGVKCSRTSGRV
ncbi:unnamed protein product [Brassica napus]|uniref:(rape) hypothetical protein n=1 Tax=Brassica napus TaxID=3708 RepID=A0A816QPY0_BRANA|nr:unnamed protein product [Brassica napus]